MTNAIDTAVALRVLYLFNLPFKKWPSYKDGTIDEDGNVIKKPLTLKKKDNWTILHKLIARLKRFVAIAPGGKSLIATLAASYFMVKEDRDPNDYNGAMASLWMIAPHIMEEIANTSAGSVSGSTNPIYDPNIVKTVDNTYTRRNKKEGPTAGRKVLGIANDIS